MIKMVIFGDSAVRKTKPILFILRDAGCVLRKGILKFGVYS